MEGELFDALVKDIRQHGLVEPIVTLDGLILDGRSRFRACRVAGIKPLIVPWAGASDPLDYVISKNLQRRHLNTNQRAIVAARVANMTSGTRTDLVQNHTRLDAVSLQQAADRMHVGRVYVSHARKILTHGTADEIAQVESGTANVCTMAKLISKRLNPEPGGLAPCSGS